MSSTALNRCSGSAARWPLLALMLAVFISSAASAGELTALAWDEKAAEPTLQVSVTGSPAYEVQTYEGGQRLRLVLSDTNLAGASDIEGRGVVKGVYPYPAETGSAVYIDLLLNVPGQLKVTAGADGMRVVTVTANGTVAAAPADSLTAAAGTNRSRMPTWGARLFLSRRAASLFRCSLRRRGRHARFSTGSSSCSTRS